MVDTFSLLGYPRHFVCSDNGSEFKNEILENMFNAMGIDRRYTTPYHPSANGAAERYVQTAKKTLAKILEGAIGDWHHFIPAVQLMINNKISTRLQSTPFSLMFARNMNDYIDYRDDAGNKLKKEYMPHDELLKRIDYMSQVVFPAIQDKTDIYTDRQKEKADRPYRVVRQTQGGSYILRDIDETLMSRNYSPEELKLISQDEIIPKDELYEIEAIIDHRGEPGNREYLVRWKNYSKDDDSWLTSDAFTDPESINNYWRKLGKSLNKKDEVVNKKGNDEKRRKQKLPSDYKPGKLFEIANEQSSSKVMSRNQTSAIANKRNTRHNSNKSSISQEQETISTQRRNSTKRRANANNALANVAATNNTFKRRKRATRN
ncbi:hypothetical protein G6F57_014950 [Rhizopus arrhizus]|nr:hypothetical protein G6F57_014950 [Rhizopus arrhizus]